VKSSRFLIRLMTTACAVWAVSCAEIGETQAQHTFTPGPPPPFESSFVSGEQSGTAGGGGLPNAQEAATVVDEQGVIDDTNPEVPPVPEFLTQDDLAPLLSRLNELELVTGNLDDGSGVEYLETPSIDSLRVFNGRLHVDEWGFPISSTGINLIENGDPRIAPKNRVLLRRVRLSVAGKVPPQNVSYHLDLEFSGTDRGQVRDAWVGIDDLGRLHTLRIGNQKRPYGLDELNSSNFMVFLERPFTVSAFNEENRRFGAATYGVSDDKRFNWRAGGFHLRQFQNSGSIVDNLNELEVAGRLASTPFYDSCSGGRDYLHCALSGSVGFPSDDPSDTTAQWRTRPEARSGERWLDTGVIGGVRAYELLNVESVLNLGAFRSAVST
jgi:phosphate-selective porin OprO/OprP